MSNPGDRFKKDFMPSPTGSPRGVNPGITMGVPRSSTWTICFSKTWKRNFYLHLPTLESFWEKPKDFQDEDLYPDYEPELPELSDDDLDPHIQDAIEGSFDEYNTHYHQNKEAFEETERRAVEKDKAKKGKQEAIDFEQLQEFLAGRPRHIREPTFRVKIEKKKPSFMEALQEGLTCDPRSFGSSGQSTSDGRIRSTSFGSAQLSQPSSSVSATLAGRGQPSLFGSATSAGRGQSGLFGSATSAGRGQPSSSGSVDQSTSARRGQPSLSGSVDQSTSDGRGQPGLFGSVDQSTSAGRGQPGLFGSATSDGRSQPSSSGSATSDGRSQPSSSGSVDQSTSAGRGQLGSPSWSQLVQEDRRKRKDSSPPPPEKTKR